ncbi:MAG: hypothetical protein AAB362_03495 [Patescibacteria group bacterium]
MEKENAHLVIKVMRGKEDAVLTTIRSHGFRASLMLDFYDVFVDIPLSMREEVQEYICQIPGVVKVAYTSNGERELKHAS